MINEENSTNDQSESKPLFAETKICSICLVSGSTDDNDPIVYCDRCGVIVHESCYNADTLDDKSSDSSSPSEYWFCTPCLAHVDDPICAVCPTRDRCSPFWPTLESSWIHVVCALAVPGALFYDELFYTPVDLSNISPLKFGNKICHLCESRSGVTVSCDAGLCPNAFHLSCANKNGLLQIRGELSKIECELYCVTHQSATNTYKNIQRNYSICEVQQKELDQREKLNEEIRESLDDHYKVYQKRIETFPRLPCPTKTHQARSLMVDTIALKKFFDKAQRLRPNQSNLVPTNLDLTSPDTNALLAFTANEEELTSVKQKIHEVQNKLQQLESSNTEKQLQEQHNKLEIELKKEYDTLATLTEKYNQFIEIFQLFNCQLKDETLNQFANNKPQQISTTTSTPTSITTTTTTTEFHCCSVCNQSNRSNPMIKCYNCQLSFHGDCLKPPMPSKTLNLMLAETKKYQWQCASCVNAQQEELDQCNVDVDQPRRIRPRKTNELVLRETLNKFGSSRKRKSENTMENKKSKKKRQSSLSEQTSTNNVSRTDVIQQLFSRTATDFTDSSAMKSSNDQQSTENSFQTPVRSKSLTTDRQTPKIFKQKALSVPTNKIEKKKRQTIKKDDLSIFDFSDDDQLTTNETIQLRSTINQDQQEKPKKTNRRSTSKVQNQVPEDAVCKECFSQGTSQTMTDCDKCKDFYHFSCCVPPLTSFPKRRNYGWTCHRCNEESEHEHSNEIKSNKNFKRERKNPNQSDETNVSMED